MTATATALRTEQAPAPPAAQVTYAGYIGAANDLQSSRYHVVILPDRKPLPQRQDLYNHSPDGFSWGDMGSGPAQLALAICAHALGDDRRALRLYQSLKEYWVAGLPTDSGWIITSDEILQMAADIETLRVAHG